MFFALFFFRAELGGVQRSVSNLNFSLSGCCVALLHFWCPEVRLEFFKVSRGPCSIYSWVSRGSAKLLTFVVRDVEHSDSNFRFDLPMKLLFRPLDAAF